MPSQTRKYVPVEDQPPVFSYTEKYAYRAALIAGFLDKFGSLFDQLHAIEDADGWNVLTINIWGTYGIGLQVRGDNPRETMRTIRRAIGGKWTKGGYGDTFSIKREWGDGAAAIQITVEGPREEVCQKVVLGTETVEIPAIPAQPARTEEREKVDWVCGNLLDD